MKWLYRDNPGGEAVGFDAFESGELAAHYVCVPVEIALNGERKAALLSLNTATHPNHQGKGLFTKLAQLTFEHAAAEGFECVIGVANANSTGGFTKKLGFQLVGKLEARVGFGRLGVTDWGAVMRVASMRRLWDEPSMEWRFRNPANPVRSLQLRGGVAGVWAAAHYPRVIVWAEIPFGLPGMTEQCPPWFSLKVFIGMMPPELCRYPFFRPIPDFLKPAPLNFIYRNLQKSDDRLDANGCLINFLDFDAF